jgi:hypothetical protein
MIEVGRKIASVAMLRSHSGFFNLSHAGVLRTKRDSAIILQS